MKVEKIQDKSAWLVGSGILASLIASVCCIGPLVLTVLGISGAAALSKFETIRAPMIGIVLILFGVSGYALFRKRISCEPGTACADPVKFRKMVVFYWLGLIAALILIFSPQIIARFF